MSITRTRNFMEKTGCGLIVGIGLAAVFVFGLYTVMGGGANPAQEIPEEQLRPVATVGSQNVSANAIERHYRSQATQQLNVEGGAPVELEAYVYASVLDALLNQAAQLELAARRGVKVSDQDVVNYIGTTFDAQVNQLREQYKQFGLIKPDATEAEIQKTLGQSFGGDIAKARQDAITRAQEGLKNADMRPEYVFAATSQKLVDAYAAMAQVSDEDLKKAQHKRVFKRISFHINREGRYMGPYEIRAREAETLDKAEKALAEVKGGLSFEAAMEKYSEDPAPQGKKKSESTVSLPYSVLTTDPDYESLVDLKVGEVSPVLFRSAEAQYLIFKAIREDTSVPADFEEKKADYRKTRLAQLGSSKLREDVEEITKHDAVKWTSPGFKALHLWYETFNDPKLVKDKAARTAQFEKVAKEAKAVTEEADLVGNRAASLALYASLDRLYREAGTEKKKELSEPWVEAAIGVLENTENADLRIKVAQTLLDLERPDEALDSLVAAAQTNTGLSDDAIRRYKEIQALRARLQKAGLNGEKLKSLDDAQAFWASDAVDALKSEAELNEDYTEAGRTKFGDINTKVARLQALGLIKAEDIKTIEGYQDRWKTEKAKYDEEQAAERKKAAEEARKAAEEAKKKADEEKKTGATTPPSTPPSSSGALGGTSAAPPSNPLTGTTGG